jgi:hypothetical protein
MLRTAGMTPLMASARDAMAPRTAAQASIGTGVDPAPLMPPAWGPRPEYVLSCSAACWAAARAASFLAAAFSSGVGAGTAALAAAEASTSDTRYSRMGAARL